MKFEIKHKITGVVLFSCETETLKMCVELAIKSGADLRNSDLSNSNLSDSDLSGSDLSNSDLRGSDLSNSNLSDSDLRNSDLSNSNLRNSDLSGSNLSYSNLRNSDLRGSDLSNSNLSDSDLRGSDLSYSDLRGSDLRNSDLSGSVGLNRFLSTPLLILHEQVGKIRAYKLVNENFEGPYNGGIIYKIGATYKVDNANIDITEQCAAGINLATLDWCMRNWVEGYHILIAEFTAKDIAAIPIATDGKFRVHRCKIVGEKNLEEIGLVEKEKMA